MLKISFCKQNPNTNSSVPDKQRVPYFENIYLSYSNPLIYSSKTWIFPRWRNDPDFRGGKSRSISFQRTYIYIYLYNDDERASFIDRWRQNSEHSEAARRDTPARISQYGGTIYEWGIAAAHARITTLKGFMAWSTNATCSIFVLSFFFILGKSFIFQLYVRLRGFI